VTEGRRWTKTSLTNQRPALGKEDPREGCVAQKSIAHRPNIECPDVRRTSGSGHPTAASPLQAVTIFVARTALQWQFPARVDGTPVAEAQA